MLQKERRAIILRAECVGGYSKVWDPEDPGVSFLLCHKIFCALGQAISALVPTGTTETAESLLTPVDAVKQQTLTTRSSISRNQHIKK